MGRRVVGGPRRELRGNREGQAAAPARSSRLAAAAQGGGSGAGGAAGAAARQEWERERGGQGLRDAAAHCCGARSPRGRAGAARCGGHGGLAPQHGRSRRQPPLERPSRSRRQSWHGRSNYLRPEAPSPCARMSFGCWSSACAALGPPCRPRPAAHPVPSLRSHHERRGHSVCA